MSRRIKLTVGVCALMAGATLCWLWSRPASPTYEGRTVEEWFERLCALPGITPLKSNLVSEQEKELAEAFLALGTNAVPYLASRIVRDRTPSRFQRWGITLRRHVPRGFHRYLPTVPDWGRESWWAKEALIHYTMPPADVLLPFIEPGLLSTNTDQRMYSYLLLEGTSKNPRSSLVDQDQKA